MKRLAVYQNGNCQVQLFSDGTRIIDCCGPAEPEFPVSIDLKITNQCDRGCAWCHEGSLSDGEHADRDYVLELLRGLPAGVEIAIGGGNPFAHPDVMEIARVLSDRGLIVNMTVNMAHLPRSAQMIRSLWASRRLHGLGISIGAAVDCRPITDILSHPNTVRHVIVGVDDPCEFLNLVPVAKVLVLGYKQYGRGDDWLNEDQLKSAITTWRKYLPDLLRHPGLTIAFDNLAIQQLDINSLVAPAAWEEFYQGDDGEFTMYINAVKHEYAESSTQPRRHIKTMDIRTLFQDIRKETHQKEIGQ